MTKIALISLQIAIAGVIGLMVYPMSPEWAIESGYMSLLVVPAYCARKHEIHRDTVAVCGLAIMVTMLVTAVNPLFIGHVPTVYFAAGVYFLFRSLTVDHRLPMMWFSIALAVYSLVLMGIYGPAGQVNYWLQVIGNLIYAAQAVFITVSIIKHGGHSDSPTTKSEVSHEHRNAA